MNKERLQVFWSPRHAWLWKAQTGGVALLVLGLWAMHRIYGTWDPSMLWLMGLIFWCPILPGPLYYVVADGVLIATWQIGGQKWVPLTTAELKPLRRGRWQLRWKDGRLRPSLTLPALPELVTCVEQSIQDAQAPEAGPLPSTGRQAAQAVAVAPLPMPGRHSLWAVACGLVIAAVGLLAVWLHEPLLLTPLILLPWAMRQLEPGTYTILTAAGLWVVRQGDTPVLITREEIIRIGDARSAAYVHTRHPRYTVLHLDTYQADALLRALKRGPWRPAEAAQSGHGPAGQERKPM